MTFEEWYNQNWLEIDADICQQSDERLRMWLRRAYEAGRNHGIIKCVSCDGTGRGEPYSQDKRCTAPCLHCGGKGIIVRVD